VRRPARAALGGTQPGGGTYLVRAALRRGAGTPFASIAEAVATWPETATATAVRLDAAGGVEVCAPLGLADLLGGVWRRNPARVSLAISRERLARHRPTQRWPGIRVIAPE